MTLSAVSRYLAETLLLKDQGWAESWELKCCLALFGRFLIFKGKKAKRYILKKIILPYSTKYRSLSKLLIFIHLSSLQSTTQFWLHNWLKDSCEHLTALTRRQDCKMMVRGWNSLRSVASVIKCRQHFSSAWELLLRWISRKADHDIANIE